MAQSGVLRVPQVQLIRGLARTMKTANLSADSRQTVPQVSSTVGLTFRWQTNTKACRSGLIGFRRRESLLIQGCGTEEFRHADPATT